MGVTDIRTTTISETVTENTFRTGKVSKWESACLVLVSIPCTTEKESKERRKGGRKEEGKKEP
jgi:hypothetical protein